MTLNINDLGIVWVALYDARSKAYNIGLKLKVPVGTLESIQKQYSDPLDQLRETVKAWLEMATQQNWQTIVEMLRSRIIGELTLASNIEAKYCQGTLEQTSGQDMHKDTQIEVLQQRVMKLQLHMESITRPQQTIERLEQKIREHQCAIEAGEKQQRELKEQLQSINRPPANPQPNSPQQEATLRKLIWRDCPKAPVALERGSLATDGTTVYFNSSLSTSVYQYNSDSQQWNTLPKLCHIRSTLVMANHKLTSVGGCLFGEATDSLLSLMGEGRDRKWLQHFPPMTVKRYFTAAICHHHFLIIIGGYNGHKNLATVEVFNTDTRLWAIASSLPHPFTLATISICGERLYLLGGWDQTGHGTRSVLTCSMSELLHSCQMLSKSIIWQHVADAPYIRSSCATLCGCLLAVGGRDEVNKYTTAIFVYEEITNSWLAMDAMKTPRCLTLVASLHDNTIMVIGGWDGEKLDMVERAKVS